MSTRPTALELDEAGRLLIDFSDGQRRRYSPRHLRDSCPCASCREKRAQPDDPAAPAELFPVLKPEETQPLTLAAMDPVGNYAYVIRFSDGHDTGIFTFQTLLSLGEAVPD
jgi:DUF971 family protein